MSQNERVALTRLYSLSPEKRKIDQAVSTETITDPAIIEKEKEIQDLMSQLEAVKKRNAFLEKRVADLKIVKAKGHIASY